MKLCFKNFRPIKFIIICSYIVIERYKSVEFIDLGTKGSQAKWPARRGVRWLIALTKGRLAHYEHVRSPKSQFVADADGTQRLIAATHA